MNAILRPDIQHANFVATEFVNRKLDYNFTRTEKEWLRMFFSNTDCNIFAFYQSVPDAMISYAIARYSRIKNRRGLRGIVLDDIIPYWIASSMQEYENMALEDIQAELKKQNIKSVEDINKLGGSSCYHATKIFNSFGDPNLMSGLCSTDKLKKLFNTYVDGYGHNSIVRTGKVVLCLENVSIMVAKVLEWCRFGAPIELSTRFVDFSEKRFYPIHEELCLADSSFRGYIKRHIENKFEVYGYWMEDRENGFGAFLENRWSNKLPKDINLKSAILGETCDVLGNLLPCATLTSLGLSVSGEGLPSILEHLALEESAECSAVRLKIIEEVEKIGAGSYLRHLDEPTESRKNDWEYLDYIKPSKAYFSAESNYRVEKKLLNQFHAVGGFELIKEFKYVAEYLSKKRTSKDKLPHQFESVNVLYRDLISFRSFRDLQRHTLSTTSRSLVTPLLGFYKYPKPAPDNLRECFNGTKDVDLKMWSRLRRDNCRPKDLQYILAMGHNVIFEMSHNLRQHELVTKTRTKWDVNDEVRDWMLKFEARVRARFPWYGQLLSRADMTKHYLFARGADEKKGIKMPSLKEVL